MLSISGLQAEALATILHRRWLLVGVGNDLRGDDAFGPVLARRLRREGLPAVDAGTAPENLTGPILAAAPDELIVADAVEMGEPIGALRLLRPAEVTGGGPSTHNPGLALFLTYLCARRRMSASILAVQPGPRGLGEGLSAEVRETLEHVFALFKRRASFLSRREGRPRPSQGSSLRL